MTRPDEADLQLFVDWFIIVYHSLSAKHHHTERVDSPRFCRVTLLCFYVIVCCHLNRHHLNLRFLVYASHSACWRRETRTATSECGKSFCRQPQTLTCVTVPWDAGSPIARWTLRRCRVWHAIKRLLAVAPRSAMYKLLHPPSAWQRFLCKSMVPKRTRAYRF